MRGRGSGGSQEMWDWEELRKQIGLAEGRWVWHDVDRGPNRMVRDSGTGGMWRGL